MKTNDIVRIAGSHVTGKISAIEDNGFVTVILDVGGTSTLPPTCVELVEQTGTERNANGQFVTGHKGIGRNHDYDKEKADARQLRQNMLNELAPFLSKIGTYIGQIKTAEKKVDAIAKMAPYCMPSLSKIEFTDETPRNLTEEQKLAEFLAARKR